MKTVPIRIAKKLKEKGFVEPCVCCYDGSDMLATYVKSVFEPINYNIGGSKNTSAPTFEEVMDWLRDKHQIHIGTFIGHDEDKIWYNFELQAVELGYNYEPHTSSEEAGDTYNHCITNAIEDALKIIK